MHIIILPGWRQNSSNWKLFSQTFTDTGYKCTVLDLPGFGVQPSIDTLVHVTDVALWVNKYIEHNHGNDEVVLVGHSFGGRVAVELAEKNPMFLKGLVLIGSPNIYRPTASLQFKKILLRVCTPVLYLIPQKLRAQFRSIDYTNVIGTDLERLYKNTIGFDQTKSLTHITIPTLLISGMNDIEVPIKEVQEISKLIPKAYLEIFQATGHDIHIEKPKLLSAKIAQYVNNL